MPGKTLLRSILLCMGFSGFIMVSLGIGLLASRYPITFLPIGLIVFGTGQLVFFCCPNQEQRPLINIILLNLDMVFLMVSGLITLLQDDALSMAGLVCFCLGLLLNMGTHILLMIWITLLPDLEKQDALREEIRSKITEDIIRQLLE